MTPTQARKILRGIVPLNNDSYVLRYKDGYLSRVVREAVATFINALLTEPPAVVRAREKLLRAALHAKLDATRTEWEALADAAADYADAIEAAKAKAKRGKR